MPIEKIQVLVKFYGISKVITPELFDQAAPWITHDRKVKIDDQFWTKFKLNWMEIKCPLCVDDSKYVGPGADFIDHAAEAHYSKKIMDDFAISNFEDCCDEYGFRFRTDLNQLGTDEESLLKVPKKCRKCSFSTRYISAMIKHYGSAHKIVFKYLNESFGGKLTFDYSVLKRFEIKSRFFECPIPGCKATSFSKNSDLAAGRDLLMDHLRFSHFHDR